MPQADRAVHVRRCIPPTADPVQVVWPRSHCNNASCLHLCITPSRSHSPLNIQSSCERQVLGASALQFTSASQGGQTVYWGVAARLLHIFLAACRAVCRSTGAMTLEHFMLAPATTTCASMGHRRWRLMMQLEQVIEAASRCRQSCASSCCLHQLDGVTEMAAVIQKRGGCCSCNKVHLLRGCVYEPYRHRFHSF